ncbi:DUF2730 family protein [Alishewanella jeotgali]|jgi:uncharacterized coiled-coil protein SlyX|uniref:DUF2730 family protein n=1 Tax=Alishewanella jeotgali KCTC 22429 TaxID=1129374 RepID=H3Z9M4_9ALTE|nr:DUF2730 family protein [Alishewanella jeotgali]EHR42725.1 hypothetical protein AJE_00125 [Alishewanella jeotgali KCTC 22429]
MEPKSWFLEWWPVLSFVFMGAMAIGGLLMRRSFVSQEQLSPLSTRVQTIEQTYAKDREVSELKLRMEKQEEIIRNLPNRDLLTQTQLQLARVEAQCKHLEETINRVERPLALMLEAKLSRRSSD